MKRRKLKQIITVAVISASILTLASCGSAKSSSDTATEQSVRMESESSYGDQMSDSKTDMASPEAGAAGIESQTEVINDTSQIAGQKLIKDVSMSVETRTFDDFINELTTQIGSLGGYVENSDVSGGSYQYENYRSGYIVARIPAERLEGFVKIVKEKGNVIRTSEQTTDVTLQYVDTESRLKALKIEQETLMTLLENATKMEDIIAIQSQLTQVRYEIESKESQIRTYDNLVNYSTVRIDITEVERETQVETKSFSNQIKAKLSDNLYAIKEGFKNFLIEFIAALPYLILWGAIIFALVIAGRKIYKKHIIKIAKSNISNGNNKDNKTNQEDNKKE